MFVNVGEKCLGECWGEMFVNVLKKCLWMLGRVMLANIGWIIFIFLSKKLYVIFVI
jgi:hypothetical protein